MYIIGLTGGTGAGKTTALKVLRDMGALALDCDEIYHELLSNCDDMIAAIDAEFRGVATDGKINRRKLAEIVWNEPPALLELNSITHEFISDEIHRRIDLFEDEGGTVTAIDAIALIESGQDENCDVVVGIIAPVEKRTARIMDRDNLSKERALLRIKAQNPESFYIENCDHILENIYDTLEEFEKKCVEFFNEIL